METLKGRIIESYTKDVLNDKIANEIYKDLFHNINSGAIIYEVIHNDNLFLIKDLNHAAEEILKSKNHELIGKNMLDAFPNLGKYKLYHTLQKVYKTGIPEQIPISYYKRDNLNLWKENYVFKLSSKYIVSIFQDMMKEKEIKQSLEKFNALFENTKDVILFFNIDESIIDVNNAAITVYGYTKEELINMKISDLREDKTKHLTKQQIESSVIEGIYFQTIHKRKDGTTFPVEVSSIGTELDGKVVRCAIVRDITERKKFKENLKESEERYRLLFEHANEIIYTHDLSGNITSVNNAFEKTLGYKRDKLLKMNIKQLLIPEYCTDNLETYEKFSITNLEVQFVHASGKKIMMEVSKNALYKDDKPYEIQAIARDISERKTAEEQIKYLTYHDKLTGLYNRLFLEQELNRLISESKIPISIIISDVNGLKLANDAFGHLIGDSLLKESSKILKDSCKDSSIVARWGGDEFIIVTPFSSESETRDMINTIKNKCEESSLNPIKPNMAIGYSIIENNQLNIEDVFKEAENFMYTNKLLESRSLRSSIISSLQETLHESTPETNEHCQRIRDLSIKFGHVIGLSNVELDKLALLSLLHDIGKIAIPKNILEKPDKLTEKEWEIMKRHCQIGYNIANSTPDLSNISELILYHHERWDGKGYPHGLKSKSIPLLSRIISIIDSYDVMLNERPYKKPMTKEMTIAELEKNSGTQFDPSLVDTFINMIQ